MRLYSGKVTPIASEVVRALVASNDIEAASPKDVTGDVESVLNHYLTVERDVNERTKDILEQTGQKQSEYSRVRLLVATEKGIKIGDETLDFLLDQVVEIFHHSANVDEIFCEDVELRRKMAPIFKKHMAVDASLDAEIRSQMRHLTEGTRDWDVEYARVAEAMKRRKGLA
ncbi:MAG: DUF507 family protein [Polyangiaceae bacterium]